MVGVSRCLLRLVCTPSVRIARDGSAPFHACFQGKGNWVAGLGKGLGSMGPWDAMVAGLPPPDKLRGSQVVATPSPAEDALHPPPSRVPPAHGAVDIQARTSLACWESNMRAEGSSGAKHLLARGSPAGLTLRQRSC